MKNGKSILTYIVAAVVTLVTSVSSSQAAPAQTFHGTFTGGSFYCGADQVAGPIVTGNWNVNIDPKTPVRDYRLRDRLGDLPFLHTAIVTGLDAVGLGAFARRFEEWGAVQAIERLNLDGLLALWHPPTAN